ncbi:MAG: hypothetical protein HY599_04110 [Candidatus Omnitrophica bacterium]|nr:hypothetical protein [Candidatus Omnitrophota bacterium]
MITEDEALELAYGLHPELRDWSVKDFDRAERDTGVNWHLHLTVDAIVLRRMSDPSLPDARVVRALEERGRPHLDAIHQIAHVLITAIWQVGRAAEFAAGRVPPVEVKDQARRWTNEDLNSAIGALVD